MVTHLNIIVNFLSRTLVALAISILLYRHVWWAPVVSFPAVTIAWCYAFRPRWPTQARYLMETRSEETLKSMSLRMLIIYVFASAVIFQWHTGAWYGWLAGGAIGLVFAKAMRMAQGRWLEA